MPELKEVFEMVSQKAEPDVDAWAQQQQRQRRAARNRRLGAFGVAAATVTVAVILAITLPGGNRTTDTGVIPSVGPVSRSEPFLLDLRTGRTVPLAKGLVPEGAFVKVNYSVSPDGTMLAYGTCLGASCSGRDVMWVAEIDGTDARRLRVPSTLNGYLPRWSPDGSLVVYQLRDGSSSSVGNVFVQDITDGRRRQLTHLGQLAPGGWWFLSARFAPDGERVIFHLPRRDESTWDVWSVPLTGGDPTLEVRDAAFPVYFPDGQSIAFTKPMISSPGGGSIQVFDAGGSRRTVVTAKSSSGIWWPEISPDGTRIAYQDGGFIYVVGVSTGGTSKVAVGDNAAWIDDDMLIVAP